jgi:hypothetical protein
VSVDEDKAGDHSVMLIKGGWCLDLDCSSAVNHGYLQGNTCRHHCFAQKGFTGKDIAASNIAPKSTIYRIIKNFKDSGSIVVKKASGRTRKPSNRLMLIQLRDRGTACTELAPVQSLLRNGSRMAWCHEGQQKSHYSPGKTSGTD